MQTSISKRTCAGCRCVLRNTMKRHVRYCHVKQQAYSCSACTYSAVHRLSVTQHIQQRHGRQRAGVKVDRQLTKHVTKTLSEYYVKVDRAGKTMDVTSKNLHVVTGSTCYYSVLCRCVIYIRNVNTFANVASVQKPREV